MRWLIPALLLALPCLPQTAPKRRPAPKPSSVKAVIPTENWPLLSVRVTGNNLYSEDQIIAVSGLKLGEVVSKAAFEKARERLFQTGVFQSVGYNFAPTSNGRGYAGAFEVVEVEQLYPVRFERLPASDKELRAFLASREPFFRDKIPGTKELVQRYTSELQEFLAARGFKDKVSGAVTSDQPGELSILFRPATPLPAIAEVKFTGNQVVSTAQLQNTLTEVAVGVPYRETTLRQLLETSIRPLYDARGRMRVAFPSVTTEPAKDVDGVRVNITVEEGPEYNFGAIKASAGVVTSREIMDLIALKKGEPANFERVNAAIDKIQQRLRIAGYMRAKTRAERAINDQPKTVDVTFISEPGPQFKMGKLNVEGLDLITEPAIRKLWTMKSGNPYNADYPGNFLAHVKDEGYFENLRTTRFEQNIDEKNNVVDVTLFFKGGPDPDAAKKKRPDQ